MFFNKIIIFLIFTLIVIVKSGSNYKVNCKNFKNGPSIDVRDLVGVWMTVYTQPMTVNCFTMTIRATTDLEREQLALKYGNWSGRVDFSTCFLQMEAAQGKHYLQGDGSNSGLFENIVIEEDEKGNLITLQEQNADQWTMFGRRGSELLFMRDCSGEALAIFCRAPYWPTTSDLYAILHRGGVRPLTRQRLLCDPHHSCILNKVSSSKKGRKGP